ncbi:ABC transporter substrate-binding protein [Micromonospora globbae]|uniref:ABC transporter substrate-binding protein n=1 Tax=Micromonospora globbae TaxID=1894969 RepID=UPI00342E7C39
MRALIDEFNTTHRDKIHVNYTELQWSDGRDKIKQALSAGTGPDAFFINAGLEPALVDGKVLAPLDKLGFTEQDTGRYSALAQVNTVDGVMYAAPLYFEAMVLIYRPDILKQYGITAPPTTWDQLKADAKKITTESGGKVLGFQLKGMDDHLNAINLNWQTFLLQAGGKLTTNNRSTQNTQAGQAALQYLRSFYAEGISKPGVSAEKGFPAGNVAMYTFLPKTAALAEKAGLKYGTGWAIAPLPKGPVNGKGWMSGHALAGNSKTKHPKEVGEFLKWMTSPHNSVKYMEFYEFHPYDEAKLTPSEREAIEKAFAENPIWAPLREQMALNDPQGLLDFRHGSAQRWPSQSKHIVAALNGQEPIEAALSAIDADIDKAAS